MSLKSAKAVETKPMAINSDIRDHAYQFFTEEAPELLQILEAGLLTLDQRSTAKVHNLMRAAHSLKGGAASVGLDAIATLAHRLENILKALYSDSLEVDTALENDLLRAYDCLRLPLMEQITTGHFNPEAVAIADPIFTQIELRCGDALLQTETYLPSSAELGIDMVTSIFEVDVAQGLDRLAAILAHPQDYEVAGELRAQIEVFIGFAELLNLPEFKTIAETAQQALNAHPDRAIEITQLTLIDLERSRQSVLAGDRTQHLEPSESLIALSLETTAPTPPMSVPSTSPNTDNTGAEATEPLTVALPQFESLFSVFGDAMAPTGTTFNQEALDDSVRATPEAAIAQTEALEIAVPSPTESPEDPIAAQVTDAAETTEPLTVALPQLESLFSVFGDATATTAREFDEALDDSIQATSEAAIAQDEALEAAAPSLTEPLDIPIAAELAALSAEVIDVEWVASQTSYEQSLDRPGHLVPAAFSQPGALQTSQTAHRSTHQHRQETTPSPQNAIAPPNLTVRVDAERLERMSNLVGELTINRNGLSLQNEQMQGVLRELLNRFARFEAMVSHLREALDQMLVAPERQNHSQSSRSSQPENTKPENTKPENGNREPQAASQPLNATNYPTTPVETEFDSLEMDSYGVLHAQLQEILESFVQLDETVDDVTLYARQSDRLLDQNRHMLTNLSSELTQARMVPLGEVLNRFPRVLRDLSATHHKPVSLKLIGTSLLVDRAILEKLYDPLLHLLRNAFDHGIEPAAVRSQLGKPKEGQIEIRAYYKGNQTIIEIKDDGQGLNLDRIRGRAFKLGLLSADQLLTTAQARLFELIFEPGFSTAQQVSELSGRGIGLDVVRSQLQSIKGTVTVASSQRRGATFTLRLPLTLTNTKLVVCSVGSTTLALPVDNVEEIVSPQADQIRTLGAQRFLYWREQIIPAYRLATLLDYAYPLPEASLGKSLADPSASQTLASPMLVLHQQEQLFAIEVDRLITEQELVIKSFGSLINPPSYLYGCTSLGDGNLIPVIDSSALLAFEQEQKIAKVTATEDLQHPVELHSQASIRKGLRVIQAVQATTILVVDDAVTLRRTLALSLERSGFRVLQARDGQEAIDQCQRTSVHLVICDIEMPHMNGFEFLSYRRQDPQIAKIPIIMLTSRSNEKHRWLAMQLGATAYFTKPYLEQELVAAIKKLLGARTE